MIIRSYDIDIRDIKRREIEGKGAMKMEKPRKEEQRTHFIPVSVSQTRLHRFKIRGVQISYIKFSSRIERFSHSSYDRHVDNIIFLSNMLKNKFIIESTGLVISKTNASDYCTISCPRNLLARMCETTLRWQSTLQIEVDSRNMIMFAYCSAKSKIDWFKFAVKWHEKMIWGREKKRTRGDTPLSKQFLRSLVQSTYRRRGKWPC